MWKSYMWTLDKEKNMKAILVVMNTSYLRSSESKAWKKIQARTGFAPMTFAIPVQCSMNWANKPTGSWLLCWFQKNPWSDE